MQVNVTEYPVMTISILENTDKYAICQYGNRVGFSFFNKHRSKSFFVSGVAAQQFFTRYRDALVAWGTEGSTYFELSKNQVLAQLFDAYSHLAQDDNLAPSDYIDHIAVPANTH